MLFSCDLRLTVIITTIKTFQQEKEILGCCSSRQEIPKPQEQKTMLIQLNLNGFQLSIHIQVHKTIFLIILKL